MKSLMVFNSAKFKIWFNKILSGEYDDILMNSLKSEFKEGKPIRNLSRYLEMAYNTVKNWSNNEKPKPSSEALYKIFDKFPELKYEDLGVKAIDVAKKVTLFIQRLGQLMEEKAYNNTSLAIDLNLDKSSVSSWRNGYSMPSEENLIKLAKLFNVSTEYLLGTTDYRKRNELNEPVSKSLEKFAPDTPVDFYGRIIPARDLEEQFDDIPEYLLNTNLVNVFQEETKRVVDYCMSETAYNKFKDTVNDREVDGLPVAFSQQCSARDVALLNLKKEVERIFNEYVKKVLIEKGFPEKYIADPDKYHIDNIKKRHLNKDKK